MRKHTLVALAIAGAFVSVPLLKAAAACYKKGQDAVCLEEGDVVDSWDDEPCTAHTDEGDKPGMGSVELIAENEAYKATVTEIGFGDVWGSSNKKGTITINWVSATYVGVDPDDCSETITIPDYAEDTWICDGEQPDLLGPTCHH